MSDWGDWLGPCDWCNEAEDGGRILCEECEIRTDKRAAYDDSIDRQIDEAKEYR